MEMFLFLCAFCFFSISECVNTDTRRLQTRLDIFLDNIIDIKHNIQDIQYNVSRLQQMHTTLNNQDMCNVSPPANTGIISAMETLAHEIESQTEVLLKGFQEEKAVVRKMMEAQKITAVEISRHVNKTRIEVTKMLRNTEEAISNVNDTLLTLRKDNSSEFSSLSIDIDQIKSEVANAVNDIKNSNYVIASVNETLIEHRTDSTDQIQKLSTEIDKVKSEKPDAQSFADFEERIMTKVLKLTLKDFKRFGSSIYTIHTDKLTWSQAQQKCNEKGNFHLAEINDKDEHAFVKRFVGYNFAWVGGTDIGRDGEWRWSTSGLKVLSSLWEEGEPNNFGGNEHCSHYYRSTNLNDRSCDEALPFVCELEL